MYGTKKTPIREKIETTQYTIHRYDRREPVVWTDDYLQVVSIDPATDTYAFRVEKRWNNGFIELLAFSRVKFNRNLVDGNSNEMYLEISEFLDSFSHHYKDAHMFLIERQMVPNYKAIKVGEQTIAYFINHCKTSEKVPVIMEVNPALKGKMLGAPKGLNYTYIKKWAVEESERILRMRCDTKSLEILNQYRKNDDMCDTIAMIEAICKLLKYPLTIDMRNKTLEPPSRPKKSKRKIIRKISQV